MSCSIQDDLAELEKEGKSGNAGKHYISTLMPQETWEPKHRQVTWNKILLSRKQIKS